MIRGRRGEARPTARCCLGLGQCAVDGGRVGNEKLAGAAVVVGLAVAGEAVLGHQPAVKGDSGDGALDPIAAFRELLCGRRQRPAPRGGAVAQPDRDRPVPAGRQEQRRVGTAAKSGGRDRCPAKFAQAGQETVETGTVDEVDRDRLAALVGSQQPGKVGHPFSSLAASGAW